MFKLSEAATWSEQKCAVYLAEVMEHTIDPVVAVNDVALDAVGALRTFALRVRAGEAGAARLVAAERERIREALRKGHAEYLATQRAARAAQVAV